MASPICFTFLHVFSLCFVLWFCPGAHKHRVDVGWKWECWLGRREQLKLDMREKHSLSEGLS